jgi:hypothetical protein
MLHKNLNNPDSKCNWVMNSLQTGWQGPEHHFWGFIGNNEQQIKKLTAEGKDWYFWDMPYYGRWNGLKQALNPEQDFYWRASRNHIHYRRTEDYPDDRFRQWGVQPKPHTLGSKILVCPSSETMTRWCTGMDVKMWTNTIVTALRKYTDRYIEVRYKPRKNGTSGPSVADIPFAQQCENTHCVVTCISLAAVEAQLLGIPTICHPYSFAADISSTKLEEIENPRRVDTQQWFNNLAYSQFTHGEIESGLAQEILNA